MSNTNTSKVLGTIFNVIVGRDKKRHAHGDPTREVFETVVFVVVLVLMLKLFVAEAFVIPTGSMASTLWGDQVKATCPDCEHTFPVTAAVQSGSRKTPFAVACQNCGLAFELQNRDEWNSGDRVLVAKYEYHIRSPRRFDVPVFKFPEEPYNTSELTAMNYIKRLVGLPGETIAIYKGDLYVHSTLEYPHRGEALPKNQIWRQRWPKNQDPSYPRPPAGPSGQEVPAPDFTYMNDKVAVDAFLKGQFEPVRKSPTEIMAVRRLVFDLDRQPKSLQGMNKTRWHPMPGVDGSGWVMDEKGFHHEGATPGWVRYQHVEPGWIIDPKTRKAVTPSQPAEIRDFLAYNSADVAGPARHWVPDLILDCTIQVSNPADRVTLDFTKSGDRYQSVFENGDCHLYRIPQGASDRPQLLAEHKTSITKPGSYALRFANVDSRLTVWVDGRVIPFGAGADYPPPNKETFAHTTMDLNEPVRIGAVGNVVVSKVQLWRDVYYQTNDDADSTVQTQFVQPGHYFCLGDNSASSEDGRMWGLVPERLILGRAVVVYWPLKRIGVIK